MAVAGIGFALAVPAITTSVVSSVPLADVGKASGTYAMMRQLGGAFGVAILAAVFARTGGYETATSFSDGFRTAMAVAGGLALVGSATSVAVPRLRASMVASTAPQSARKPAGAAAGAPVIDIEKV
jgi:MFS family permease